MCCGRCACCCPTESLPQPLEDVSFLLVWAAALLCFSTVLARGEFRGYYWMGSALGFLLYRCTLGCVTVPLLRRIFSGLGRLFRRLFCRCSTVLCGLHPVEPEIWTFRQTFSKSIIFFSHFTLAER